LPNFYERTLATNRFRDYNESINIYEIANTTRSERILISSETKQDVLGRLRAISPSPIADWQIPGDGVSVEMIAEDMPAADAAEFLELFRQTSNTRGWKTSLWRLE